MYVPATRSFPDHHTGESISCTIKEVLGAYKIADSIVSSIVQDKGSIMRRAADLLQIEKGWTGNGFENNTSIDRTHSAARKLVRHFHHRSLATAELPYT